MRTGIQTCSGSLSLLFILTLVAASPALSAREIDAGDLRKADRHCAAAGKALRKGDLSRAKSQFERALNVTSDHPTARMGLGNIMMMEQRFEAALKHYEIARDSFSVFSEVLFDLQYQQFLKSRNRSEDLRDRQRQIESSLARARERSQGRGSPQISQAEQAIAQLENEIQRLEGRTPPSRVDVADPPAEIFFYIGNAQFHLGRVVDAIESWEACHRLAPDFPSVYNNLAMAYGTIGRFDEAFAKVELAEEQGIDLPQGLLRDLAEAKRQAGAVSR